MVVVLVSSVGLEGFLVFAAVFIVDAEAVGLSNDKKQVLMKGKSIFGKTKIGAVGTTRDMKRTGGL